MTVFSQFFPFFLPKIFEGYPPPTYPHSFPGFWDDFLDSGICPGLLLLVLCQINFIFSTFSLVEIMSAHCHFQKFSPPTNLTLKVGGGPPDHPHPLDFEGVPQTTPLPHLRSQTCLGKGDRGHSTPKRAVRDPTLTPPPHHHHLTP